MNLHTLALIILWSLSIILFLGTCITIFIIGRRSIKDNPNEALIFVKTGLHISKPIKAKKTDTSKIGSIFSYGKKIVLIPSSYGEHYHKNKRLIFISREGQLVASPFDTNITLLEDEKENLIYELVSGHIGADAMKALKGSKTINVIIIAVVAFAFGIIAVFSYNYIQSYYASNIPTEPAISEKAKLPNAIEIK